MNLRKRLGVVILSASAITPSLATIPTNTILTISRSSAHRDGNRQISRKDWRGKWRAFKKLDLNKAAFLSGVEVELPANTQAN
jgi:hypothetical protein